MKKNATFLKLQLFIAAGVVCLTGSLDAQTYSWVKQYHGSSRLMSRDLANAPSGDNYSTAEFQGTVSIAGEEYDEATSGQLIIKHDGAGSLKWVLPMHRVAVAQIKATESHVYLAGIYNGKDAYLATHHFPDIGELYQSFIVRITENGVVDLVVNLTGNDPDINNQILDMDVDASGRMYITGRAGENAVLAGDTLKNIDRPMFIARIEQDGTIGWVTTANTTGGARITTSSKASRIFVSVLVADGDVVNFDNSTVIYTHTSDGNPNGGYFLLSCDNNGVVLQTKMLVSSRFRIGVPQIELSGYNDLYVVMTQQYDSEHIARYDTLMQKMWEFRDPDRDASVHDIAVDVSGNLLMAGAVQGEATFSGTRLNGEGTWSGYVAKYDNNGNLVWITGAINNSSDDGASIYGVGSDSHTDVYITGMFAVPAQFPGYATLTPEQHGILDFFVARIRGLADYESVAEYGSVLLKVYPTLTNGSFTIRREKASEATCILTDVSGRTVLATDLSGTSNTIECSLPNGLYFVSLHTADGEVSKGKIIIKN